MRDIALKDLTWVATVEFENYPDSQLYFACIDYPWLLDAVARTHSRIKDRWPYEIISIEQQIL
jgi:hypothetical protein